MRMRAVFCPGSHAIELREVPAPTVTPGDVVVRVHACGICGSDLHYYLGEAEPPRVCLGHEICGRVEAGPETLVGAAVVIEPLLACGHCSSCRAGRPNLCPALRILGSMAPGGLADRVVVPATAVYRLPDGLDLDAAVLAEPLAVAVHAVRTAALEPGDDVLVLGGGAVGLLTAYTAAQSGGRVTVSARHPHQRRAALALGAADAIAADPDAVVQAAAARVPDVVFETVGGTADTLPLALDVVRAGGRIVALGKFTRPIVLPPLRFLMKEVTVGSSMTYDRRAPRSDFAVALALLAGDRDRLAALVTHRVSLAEAARAFAAAADKRTGAIKVAVHTA